MNTKDPSELSLGERIRLQRKEDGLRLTDLAEKCNISPSFLSQIERNQASPSISTLHNIAEAFGVPLAHFFVDTEKLPEENNGFHEIKEEGAKVVRSGQRKTLIYPGSGIKNELLSPDLNRAIQMMWVVIPPGAETGPEGLVHEGEECGLIIQGKVQIWVGEQQYILGPGDSIYQKSNIPHRSRNIGDEDVIVVTAITPPSF
jgi:transcriptional regulator with XRE-family HTH domain